MRLPPSWPLLQVIVTVEGPSVPIVVRQKERVAGIWINQGAMSIEDAPSFYAVMSTGPLADILSPEEDKLHRISIPMGIGAVRMKAGAGATSDYLAALRADQGSVGVVPAGTGFGAVVAAKPVPHRGGTACKPDRGGIPGADIPDTGRQGGGQCRKAGSRLAKTGWSGSCSVWRMTSRCCTG